MTDGLSEVTGISETPDHQGEIDILVVKATDDVYAALNSGLYRSPTQVAAVQAILDGLVRQAFAHDNESRGTMNTGGD